jgi:ubiquitin-activating enzyme E1
MVQKLERSEDIKQALIQRSVGILRGMKEGVKRSNETTDVQANLSTSKRQKMIVSWGEWMGSWKAEVDHEAERIDRQKAAYGGDTVQRLKDLNVLIVGCRGVGIEAAKNLILSNVGGVVLYDDEVCRAADRGTNFYITENDVAAGTNRAKASLPELRSLNPFCRVDVHNSPDGITDKYLLSPDVLGTGRPFSAVVVSTLITEQDLFRLNEVARANGIAFILAVNHGVTSSIFSDFGPRHEILDATGEPTQTLAVSNVEIVEKSTLLDIHGVKEGEKVVIVTVAQTEHGLDDGDMVVFDDMRDDMASLNGKAVMVRRVAISSPVSIILPASNVWSLWS